MSRAGKLQGQRYESVHDVAGLRQNDALVMRLPGPAQTAGLLLFINISKFIE